MLAFKKRPKFGLLLDSPQMEEPETFQASLQNLDIRCPCKTMKDKV
jgi:hypothetical protein